MMSYGLLKDAIQIINEFVQQSCSILYCHKLYREQMGNQMGNCQQCHIQRPQSTRTNAQTTQIVLADKKQKSTTSSQQIQVANKTVQKLHLSFPQTQKPNHSYTVHTNTVRVPSSKIYFTHNSQLINRDDVRLGYQLPTSSPQQIKFNQSQPITPYTPKDIVTNQVRYRELQRIIPTSQIRHPQQKSVVNQTQKIKFNYNLIPQHQNQRVPINNINNQASFSGHPFQQNILFRSHLIQPNRVTLPTQSIVQPITQTQIRPTEQNKTFNVIVKNSTTQLNNTVKERSNKDSKNDLRQLLESEVDLQDTFLTHHLRYQLSLTKYASMKRIRKRQIMEHIWLESQWENFITPRDLKIKFGSYSQSIISAWMQITFLDIWEQAHNDFFVKHLDYKFVRYKVAEQYMHQLFQLKQFADSSAANLNFLFCNTQFDLNTFLQYSDDSLLHLFKKLKDRYPQTSSKEKIQFPDVPTTKTNINILDHFPALSFSDPKNLNYQTIYEDINFLLNKAMEEQDVFKEDMKEILGADVLGCTKVGQVTKDGKSSFNACAVRRVFVKWAENILQKCPDLFESRSFMRFVQTRGKIANNFIFKSTVQDSTHKFVIDTVSLLLEAAKFSLKDNDIKKRQQFIFNIYDLLRCKIKRSTPAQIVSLLQRMKSTSVTKNGKKFEVIRVKNRFNTNNRDLLINFRYGDVLIGEAQLCVDNSQLNKQAKLNYDFCHYIYQLERSIFGPTLELMMEYEDFQRPDITVNFEAEDVVLNRKNQKIQKLQNINRKCIQGHKMVSLVGNVVFSTSDQEEEQDETVIICNYCDSRYPCSRRYDYCYLCGCMLCTDCRQIYDKANKSTFYLSIQSNSSIPCISTQLQLQQLCQINSSVIVLFWLQNSSASELLRDGLVYQQSKQMMQPNKYVPRVAMVKYSNHQSVEQITSKYRVKSFPTIILLDNKANAVRTVMGCSWFQVPVLYSLQQMMIQEGAYGKSITYCIDGSCKKEMLLNDLDTKKELVCQICFSRSQFIHFPPQIRDKGFFCQNSHYQCINCCYINFDTPTTHQDFMGLSYLSSNFAQPIIQKCLKGHNIQRVYQNYPNNYLFKCSGCQRQNFIDNQHGVGSCQTCNIKLCSSCLGAKQLNYQSLQGSFQLVSHFVQSTAEDTYLCVCKRFLKKTYQKRYLQQKQFITSRRQNATWQCLLCKSSFKEGQLHIACFCCPYFYDQQSGQNINSEVCYQCAKKSKMIRQKNKQIQKQKQSYFTCPSDHKPMVLTSVAYNKQLIFNCYFCTKSFYRNTSRFYCKQCTLNVCKECSEQLEKSHFHPPTCKQTCPKEHNLQFQFVKEAKWLQFCDGCMCTLFDEKFTCQEDDYSLCVNCTKNNPPQFKGTSFIATQIINQTAKEYLQ